MSDLQPDSALFWSHTDRSGGPDACWPWTAGLGTTGYGKVTITRAGNVHRTFKAHRIAWEFVHGPIPDGLQVLHHCDNRPCCNSESDKHLFLGTHIDNMKDGVQKGRWPTGAEHAQRHPAEHRARGERHGMVKLSLASVKGIRDSVAGGALYREAAEQFDCTVGTVGKIVRRERWAASL